MEEEVGVGSEPAAAGPGTPSSGDTVSASVTGCVGGCRPVELLPYVRPEEGVVEQRLIVTAFGVPSELVIARPR